jgi:hypothetical protein
MALIALAAWLALALGVLLLVAAAARPLPASIAPARSPWRTAAPERRGHGGRVMTDSAHTRMAMETMKDELQHVLQPDHRRVVKQDTQESDIERDVGGAQPKGVC